MKIRMSVAPKPARVHSEKFEYEQIKLLTQRWVNIQSADWITIRSTSINHAALSQCTVLHQKYTVMKIIPIYKMVMRKV